MRSFFDDNVFLSGTTAKKLYKCVRDLPIYDYHCHLNSKEIYEDKVFDNLTQLWLDGDHYKWRLMRMAGVEERFVTGDATDKEKFVAFASILSDFCGNPVYHWAHMELKKYFGLNVAICAENAEKIWNETLRQMQNKKFSARNLIAKSGVSHVITTDETTSDLCYHKLLAKDEKRFCVKPSFRCDALFDVSNLPSLVQKLNDGGANVVDFDSYVCEISRQADCFARCGATTSDISLKDFPPFATVEQGRSAFDKIMSGSYTAADVDAFTFNLIVALGRINNLHGWTMQLHVSVLRNNNSQVFNTLGKDVGCDSIADSPNVANIGKLLDLLDSQDNLPRMVVYTMCENSYKQLLTMLGCFAGRVRGKLQLGAAWWFCDSRDGIVKQLTEFANNSGLGLFNGMLTDSRSFTSYARHDYFRRVLCSVVGKWVDDGEVDFVQAKQLVQNVSYNNALNNFGK